MLVLIKAAIPISLQYNNETAKKISPYASADKRYKADVTYTQ